MNHTPTRLCSDCIVLPPPFTLFTFFVHSSTGFKAEHFALAFQGKADAAPRFNVFL